MTTSKTSSNQAVEHRRDRLMLIILSGILLLGLAATLAAYFVTRAVLERERLKIFNQASERIQQWVEERMLNHVNSLRGLQAFWAGSSQGVTEKEFADYINSLNILNDYPGISSVSFLKLSGDKLITTYLLPLEGREAAVGFDHYTVPARKVFLDEVRDSGEILSSQPIVLITTKRSGLFLTAPLYSGGGVPPSVEERRGKLIGFVNLAFRDNDLFTAIFGRQNPLPDIDFHIYHGDYENEPGNTDQLLFDSDSSFLPVSSRKPQLVNKMRVTVGQHPWTIFTAAKPSFSLTKTEESLPKITLIAGLVLWATSGLVIFGLYRRHLKTWHD